MTEEGKKISFGFSKTIKKPDLKSVKQTESKKVDYIEYVDNKSIKVIGEEKKEEKPLIIPMLGPKSWHNRIINKVNDDIYGSSDDNAKKNGNSNLTEANKKLSNGKNEHDTTNYSKVADDAQKQKETGSDNSTVLLEELAAREIIKDLKGDNDEEQPSADITIEQSNNLEGKEESTLEDYEKIPVDKFGLALLRGMGWEPEKGIGKNPKVVPVAEPKFRPIGLGLGADNIIIKKQNPKPKTKEEEQLKLEKGCYVRVIAGVYNNNFGRLENFDHELGRLTVKLAIGNKSVSLNEYLVEPVTKENYLNNSKVLNISTYEKYSNIDGGNSQNSSDTETRTKEDNGSVQNKSLNHERTSRKHERFSSHDGSSDSDGNRKRKYESNDRNHYHKSKKSKKYRRDNDSELSRKNTKKDNDREKTRDRSKSHHSDKSIDIKKNEKHKRSHSRSYSRR